MSAPYLWPSTEAMGRLNALLVLPATGEEQDWEVELADATRLDEWADLLMAGTLAPDDRSALALLVTNGVVYADDVPLTASTLDHVRRAIHADQAILDHMKSYWADFFASSGDAKTDQENAAFLERLANILR